MNIGDWIDFGLTDKSKAAIIEKFGEYTPDSIKRFFISEGAPEATAEQASKEIEKAAKDKGVDLKMVMILGGGTVALLLLALILSKK